MKGRECVVVVYKGHAILHGRGGGLVGTWGCVSGRGGRCVVQSKRGCVGRRGGAKKRRYVSVRSIVG